MTLSNIPINGYRICGNKYSYIKASLLVNDNTNFTAS